MALGLLHVHTWVREPGSLTQPKDTARPLEENESVRWIDGFALTKGAKNIEQAYAFLNYIHSKEGSAAVAEGSGYNPGNKDATPLLSEKARAIFAEAYPGDSLKNMWWRPVEASWFAELRTQYAEKFKAA